jgi:hypothetical protein
MKHAVGADHLIYGWFFFAFVIVCLLGIGEVIRHIEKRSMLKQNAVSDEITVAAEINNTSNKIEGLKTIVSKSLVVIVLLVLGMATSISINSAPNVAPIAPEFKLPFNVVKQGNVLSTWRPEFKRSTSSELLTLQYENLNFVYFTAYYDGIDGELISTQNDIFGEKRWSMSDNRTEPLVGNFRIKNMTLKSVMDEQVNVYYLYVINGAVFIDTTIAKLYQVWLKLQGKQYDGVFLAISVSTEFDENSKNRILVEAINALQVGFEARVVD